MLLRVRVVREAIRRSRGGHGATCALVMYLKKWMPLLNFMICSICSSVLHPIKL